MIILNILQALCHLGYMLKVPTNEKALVFEFQLLCIAEKLFNLKGLFLPKVSKYFLRWWPFTKSSIDHTVSYIEIVSLLNVNDVKIMRDYVLG